MNYINNFNRPITLGAAATTAALDLPDGTFRLCISNAARTQLEVLDAAVIGGSATLTRGLEGTTAQAWPEGSSVYASVTAGMLAGFGGGGGGAMIGVTDPAPELLAPLGTVYVSTDTNSAWVALSTYIRDERDEVYWAKIKTDEAPEIVAISFTSTFDALGFDFDQQFVSLSGSVLQFDASIADIYTTAALSVAGSVRSYTVTAPAEHIRLVRYADGNAMLIVTPLTISTAP